METVDEVGEAVCGEARERRRAMAAGGGTVAGRVGGTDAEWGEAEAGGMELFEGDGGRGVSLEDLLIWREYE